MNRRKFLQTIGAVLGVAAVDRLIPRQSPIQVSLTGEWEEWSNTTGDASKQVEHHSHHGGYFEPENFITVAVGDWYMADGSMFIATDGGWTIVKSEA